MKTVIIDNYDSFTYNLFQQVGQILGEEPLVVKNDALSFEDFLDLEADNIIISPGPGRPERKADFGICEEVILKSGKPILGVCLGHQGIAQALGGTIEHASEPYHGRLSPVIHDGQNLFLDIPQSFNVVRYHSLIVNDLPANFRITAKTESGIIMGIEHLNRPFWGIQFHPESILTEYGDKIIKNFFDLSASY